MTGTRRLELEAARKEALRLAQVRGEVEALETRCRESIAAIGEVAAQQLAAPALAPLARALDGLSGSQPDAALREVREIEGRIQVAIAHAEAQASAWADGRARSVAGARGLVERAAALARAEGESTLMRAATELAQSARALAENGQLDAAAKTAEQAERAIEAGRRAALEERERREVVRSLRDTLLGMGFVVARPGVSAAGVVTLEGRLASGRRARFEIHLDGQLEFDLDGYEGRACAADVERVETVLRDKYGVRLGPPQVIWKSPDRLSQGALDLPQTKQRGS